MGSIQTNRKLIDKHKKIVLYILYGNFFTIILLY